ncbi:MAG: hypothetical protein J6X42_00995 [Alphaproteobacteria bacterium]|nr:hypothetical protein [Alphaproteobacteria bacterium]
MRITRFVFNPDLNDKKDHEKHGLFIGEPGGMGRDIAFGNACPISGLARQNLRFRTCGFFNVTIFINKKEAVLNDNLFFVGEPGGI